MKAFKVPGPNGFHPYFFEKYWHIAREYAWHLVKQAFLTSSFNPRLLEILIMLNPRVEVPNRLSHFRPTSLCNVLYKIITKVLVNHLQPFLKDIVGPFQSSFLPGKVTTDNVIIAQEIVNHMHRSSKKKGSLTLKIDLHKAYNSVDLGFLRQLLVDFGFPPRIIDLIMFCVSTSSLSTAWNVPNWNNFLLLKAFIKEILCDLLICLFSTWRNFL